MDLAIANGKNKIALRADCDFMRAPELQPDSMGIGSGSNFKIVFQLSLIAVVNQINPGVNLLVAHARVLRHIAVPACRIASDEIIAFAGK